MDELIKIFKTRAKSLEILLLLKGLKPVVRQIFYPEEIASVKEFCKKNRLYLVNSEFKIKLVDEAREYSNKGIAVNKDDRNSVHFYYISKDEFLIYKAALYEVKKDHHCFGRILGYPDCCIKFFSENAHERECLDNDYVMPVLKNSPGSRYSFYTNIFQRKEDYMLLCHFPCSLSCESSMVIGERHFGALKEYNPVLAEEFRKSLSKKINVNGRQLDFF